MLLEKKIKPLISNEFPLEQTVEAIAMIQNRKATGKVIVTVDHAGDLF
jgi:NADPH:quinone reductase-like Zn-dependent oxidoreductase